MNSIKLSTTERQFVSTQAQKIQRLQEHIQILQLTIEDFLSTILKEAGHSPKGWRLSSDFLLLVPSEAQDESN